MFAISFDISLMNLIRTDKIVTQVTLWHEKYTYRPDYYFSWTKIFRISFKALFNLINSATEPPLYTAAERLGCDRLLTESIFGSKKLGKGSWIT